MRVFPTARRLHLCGLAALAGLLMLSAARPAAADEGVVRVSDRTASKIVQTGHTDSCTTAGCATDPCCEGCGNGCPCGPGCECDKGCCGGKGLLRKLFGKNGSNGSNGCKCGTGCQCNSRGKCIGQGICSRCGNHGLLYRGGLCGVCCMPGIPVPCLGLPVPACFGQGAIGGCYGRVYALNPNYHDFRDGAVYAAQGYNAPIAVPLAPNVHYQMNYGWGVPSSRLTPVSRVVPSPYAPMPNYQVPAGYTASGSMVPPAPAK